MLTNKDRISADIQRIAECTSTPGNGCTRFSYTPEYRQAIDIIRGEMEQAGLSVREDAAGVLIGRLEGRNPDAPVTLIGSHLDTVLHGGAYDGAAGICAALEIARVFREQHFVPAEPIEFAAFPETEGARFGAGNLGSRAFCGMLSEEDLLRYKDPQGTTLYDAMASYGAHPEKLTKAPSPNLKRFLELHVEQGPILESGHCNLGIAEAISGVYVMKITVNGRADHTGTTPMNQRADSFLIAARATLAVTDAALALADGTVATVGDVKVFPGSYNIIPGQTVFTVDIRSKSDKSRIKVHRVLMRFLETTCMQDKDLSFSVEEMVHCPAVLMDESMRRLLTSQARKSGFTAQPISSGAFHDSVILSELCPTAMIFVPSKEGLSHCAAEYTSPEDLQIGVETLCQTLMELLH